jgi:predicted metal-dependent peptidase
MELDKGRVHALEERLGYIAARMTLWHPFIAAAFTKLARVVDNTSTAATDGRNVYYGLDFCEAQSDEALYGVCLHEAMHPILLHPWRGEGLDHKIFNIAADGVINFMIRASSTNAGGCVLPDGGVDIEWITAEMSTEDVYARLLRDPDEVAKHSAPGGDGDGDGDGGGGYSSGGGGWDKRGDLKPGECASDAIDMEAAVTAAARMAKACGDSSALVDRIVNGGLAPSVSWVEYLRKVMTSAAKNDYSYRRFNRRMMPVGLYLPTLYSESMGGMVVAVDTSGSVGQRELDQIAGEITAIAEDCRPEWVEVVYCDTKVAGAQRFYAGDDVVLEAKGGGGTRFEPVFEHVIAMEDPVAAVVYLTDLCGSVNNCEDPRVPVIWGCTYPRNLNMEVPFGTVVEVKV